MKHERMINCGWLAPAAALALAALASLSSCGSLWGSDGDDGTPAYTRYLYMTDTVSGKVYTYDPSTRTSSSSSIAATGHNASAEIEFHQGIGYVTVGSGADEGVYYFDPSKTNPSFTKISGTVAAQYLAFSSATKAYVSTYGGGIYTFNPSSPGSGLSGSPISNTSTFTVQELVVAGGYLYAADNGHGAVLRIDPSDDSVKATISTTKGGTTGLVAGTYDGTAGVFVANTGGYDGSWNPLPGSIDFIAASGSTATKVADAITAGGSIYPARVVQLADGNLFATGYGHTYRIALSGATATTTEASSSGASFGSLDIAYKDGLVYVPVAETSDYVNYASKLYVLDESGSQASYSPLTVMSDATTVGIANIGFYED